MPPTRSLARGLASRMLWPMATVGLGLFVALMSWRLQVVDPWWSGMLANTAVALLILAPGEWVLSQLRTSFERVEGVAEEARETAESARQATDLMAQSLDEVRRSLLERQNAEHQSELGLYKAFVENVSRDSLIRGLWHATNAGVVTSAGVRSPVWETDLHYRYVVSDGASLKVNLEEDNGRVLSTHVWESGVPAERFFQELVLAVRAAGRDLGVNLNDPTESIQQLSDLLTQVTSLRAQELAGYRATLHHIIERVDGWYFTENYILPKDDLQYAIRVDRLNEMDWEEHLRGKGWYGATSALAFARRLYRKK